MLVKEALTFRACQATDIIFIARLSGDAFVEYSSKAVSHTLDMVGRYTTWVAVRGSDAFSIDTDPPEAVRFSISAAYDDATLERALLILAKTLREPHGIRPAVV